MKLQLDQVSKSFGRLRVLEDVALTVTDNMSVGILGPNGSGKTTLIKSILGLVHPDDGNIYFNGKSISNDTLYRRKINYIPQHAFFPSNLSVTELLLMIKDLRGKPRYEDELKTLFEIDLFEHKKFGALSGGMKQKVNILLALMFEGDCIILDEPITGLDPVSQIKLKSFLQGLREQGKTLMITTHIIPLLEDLCETILFLMDGKITYYGLIADLLEKYSVPKLELAIPELIKKSE